MKWIDSVVPIKTDDFWRTPYSYFWAYHFIINNIFAYLLIISTYPDIGFG